MITLHRKDEEFSDFEEMVGENGINKTKFHSTHSLASFSHTVHLMLHFILTSTSMFC